jgi:uncharacterized protein YcbK (DUF882 family)
MNLKFFEQTEFTDDGVNVFSKMDAEFLRRLDRVREACGFPFQITSSYRSPEKNKRVGGSLNSMHLQGRAVDIACTNSVQRWVITREAIKEGLTVGIMPNAIHLDNRPAPILFHYYERFKAGKSKDE